MAAQDLRIRISADGSAAIVGMRKVQDELGRTGRSADELNGGFGRIAAGLKSLALTAAAGMGVAELARAFITAATESQKFQASLTAITGSSEAAGAEMDYIKAVAERLGITLADTATAWISLSAAAKGTALEGQAARDIFEAVGLAMGKLGKSSADTQGALLAIEQMISKGTVSAEELRGQLGERLPGAFGAAASAMGVTTAELGKLLESGAITADELLPKLAAELNRLYDNGERVGGLTAEWNRLGNALTETAVATDEATGITELLSAGLQQATDWAQALTGVMTEAGPALAGLGVSLGGWEEALSVIPGYLATIGAALAELPNYNIVIRDGALALEEQGTAWAAVAELVAFVGQSFVDLPDNLRAAVFIILGEIDILKTNFRAGMDQLPLIAEQAWAAIQNAITSAIGVIQLAVAEMVAYVAGQLASLATDMAGVMTQIPEVLDIGGVATSAVASLNDLATSLNSTEASVAALKEEQAALSAQQEQDAQALKGQQEAIVARAEAEIAAIRGVIQSGIEEAEAKKAARQAQAALEKQSLKTGAAITGGGKAASGAVKPTKDLAAAKGGAAKASKELEAAQRAETQAMAAATRTVEGLVQKYLPAKAAAQDYQESMAALAKAGEAAGLSQEELRVITDGLAKDQAKAADAARRESDAFYAAWADAVDSLDDTFQGLWRSLITGQGNVLGNLKETVLEWVADLSYQLLLSPLIVPIQGALMGIMGGGAGGVTGTATSLLGGASSLSNVFSGFSSLASGITNVFSGAALTGIMDGFGAASNIIAANGYFGGFGANMALGSGAASTGSTSFAIGAAMPYLLPAAAIAAIGIAVFNKWQSDQEPRYGTLAAMTGGSAAGLEDSEWGAASGAYVQGSFGLSFGLTDKGSKNMEATELTEIYQALADISDALAEFFGEDLSSFIEAELQRMSDFGDGLIHLTEDEGDLGGAMAALVERIALAAGKSSEDIGIAFGAMVGDLSGTAEEVGKQIQDAMIASTMIVELSGRFAEPLGQMLALTGDIATDVVLLSGYIDDFGASGETSAEAMARLTAQLGLLDAAAKQTATNLEGLSASALLTLSDDLIAAFGGIEAASQAQAFYYQEFTTGTEKLVDAIQAAADQIDREIPKLQDELMQLSEDVATAVTALADDLAGTGDQIASGLANVATPDLTPLYQTIDEGLSGSGQWEEINAKLLEQQAEAWAKSIADWDTLFGVDPPFLLEVTRGLEQYGSTLEQFGYVVDEGAQAFLDSLRQAQQAAADVAANSDVPTETITTPGDPNAAILAQLLNDLPKTREGFEDLIGAIDLTTEAGQKLYAGLLELAPQFDLLYDGAEAFSDWLLGVDDVGTALRELERVFSDWGLALPENRDDLLALYESGTLTTEQMAILGAYLAELGLVFGDLSEDANDLSSELNEAMAALRRAVAAEKDALAETHEARMKALNAELEAANEALGDAQSLLNTVQGALNTLESAQGVSANEVNAALAQLTAWASSGVTPDQEALSATLATLSAANANDYATAADYQAVQDQQYAALLALEQQGLATVDTAQATVDALEAQLEQETAWYEAEIERLDAMLASAEDQVAMAEGTYEALLSVDAALAQLNALLAGAGVDPVAGDTGTAGGTSDTPGGAPGSVSQEQTASLEAIRAEIAALRADLLAISSASQARLINVDDTLTKWDKDGLPAGDGAEITLLRAA